MLSALLRPRAVSLIALGIMGSMILTSFPLAGAAPTPTAVGTVSIGGITWTEDIRVTRNGAQDTHPQITVDAGHDAHIMWQSARSPTGYYYVKLNRMGEFLSQETFIPGKVLAGWGPSYPLGPTIDIDSQNNLHIVYDNGWTDVKYMKFDEQGNVLVPEKNVGPSDGTGSHTPSIAVGTDDTVHISHEEYKFQCEDITYSKLANDGSDIWLDRVVSSDVASHCEFDLIKVDRFSGAVMFTFGSASGTWLGRYNKFGVKDMASLKLRSQTDYLIADVAATPDGTMHVVWTDNGKVLYTRVNATGVKILDAVQISSSASQTPGFPRIASASDGRAVVVWDDARAGNKEIFFAIIDPSLIGSGGSFTAPENVRLTTAGGDSTDPWIAIDKDDNYHVAWVDNRDGNPEIYYKFAYNFALELYADPIDVANMIFIHPNETKMLPMLIKNKGGLEDGYNLNLDYTTGADALGWRITIDKTFIEALGSEETTPINLTVRAPGNAKQGDNISITVNASSISAPSQFDRIELHVFVKVSRGVKLNVDAATKFGDNGETIAFNMLVTNTGDVQDTFRLEHIPGTGPSDWVVGLDKAQVTLDTKTSTNFTVAITIPENAPGLVPALFGVSAISMIDGSVFDPMQLTVGVKAAFIIKMVADPPQRSIDPGQVATYAIGIQNVGNLPSQVQINVEAQNPTLPGFTALLDRETIYLRGGDETRLQLNVGVPGNAVADTRLTLVVQGFSPQYGTEGRIEVTTFVNRVQSLDFQVSSALPARVGRPVSVDLTVANNGNGDETLQLNPSFTPPGWTIEFLDGPATITNIFVAHGQTKTVQIRVTIGSDALAGRHDLAVGALDALGHAHIVPFSTSVVQFFSVDMTTPEYKLEGSPGGTLEYDLIVTNNGNGPDNFTLSTDGLTASYGQARFFRVTIDDAGNELREPISGLLPMRAHQTQQVKMLVSVPLDAKESTVQFSARVSSQGQEEDAALLQIDVKKADLKPGSVSLTPTEPGVGDITAITVEVQNAGDIDAKPVIVAFYDNDQLIGTEELVRVASHSRGYVTFAWLPTAGVHHLRFVIDPTDGPTDLIGKVVESNEENNVVELSKGVGTTNPLPGFEPALALGALAFVFAVARVRRRDE